MENQDPISQTKAATQQASQALLETFAAVPEDKLRWTPSDTSRSALWIVGHCGGANRAFAQGIRGEAFPPLSLEEFDRVVWEEGRDTPSREEAVRLVEESTQELLAALDALTPERMGSTVDTPFGPLPMTMWMGVAPHHMSGHKAQVDYLQTIWGDRTNHAMG